MTLILDFILRLGLWLLLAPLLPGVINKVKACVAGRRGPPVLQLYYDLARLWRKGVVLSTLASPGFIVGPAVAWVALMGAAMLVPLGTAGAALSFPGDVLLMIYLLALARFCTAWAAMETGSAFEGMGAAREAIFLTLIEPLLFLIVGALGLLSGTDVFSEALAPALHHGSAIAIWAAAIVALLVVLQVEAARLPIDDPTTHLELTMVHEVMILDHSGPDLAAIQLAAAIKLFLCSSMIATLLNPWAGQEGLPCLAANVLLCCAVAALVGTIESLIARLKLRSVPQYIVVAFASGVIALLATAWRAGGAP